MASTEKQPALSERELAQLQALLDRVPAPLEPLDISALDGFLCGILLQPQPIAAQRWLRHVPDADGRALPPGFDAGPLLALARRRHGELDAAIGRRRWFDPWVFELDSAPSAAADPSADVDPGAAAHDAVYPWVAGFATAMAHFPALMDLDAPALAEPLALILRHLDAQDLEDADELLAIAEALEPPGDLTQAVEELVRATLLIADVTRPVRPPGAPRTARPQRPVRTASERRR